MNSRYRDEKSEQKRKFQKRKCKNEKLKEKNLLEKTKRRAKTWINEGGGEEEEAEKFKTLIVGVPSTILITHWWCGTSRDSVAAIRIGGAGSF